MTHAYEPTIIDLPDAGLREFVLRDCATVHRHGEHYDTLVDMENGEVIGFAWPIDTNPALAPKAPPSPSKLELETTESARAKLRDEAEKDFLADRAGTLVASWMVRDLVDDIARLLAERASIRKAVWEEATKIADEISREARRHGDDLGMHAATNVAAACRSRAEQEG